MLPDLGKYAAEVLSAYAMSLVLLAGIVWLSWRRATRVRAALGRVEAQVKAAPKVQAKPVEEV